MVADPNTPLRLAQPNRVLRINTKVSLKNDKINCAQSSNNTLHKMISINFTSCMNCAHGITEDSSHLLFFLSVHLFAAPPRRPLRVEAFPSDPRIGALLALPPPVRKPIFFKCFIMRSALRCFVAMSAGFSAPATFSMPSNSRLT